ncbi:hypothetical protein FQN54_009566 [Arachnomyces sp. PD_36]|nr:hypothetical protein FQN54_009566 [Arachnomyces sp. PD_36]
MGGTENPEQQAQKKPTPFEYLMAWGGSPFPPTLLATLIAAQHLRPFQPLPMLFPPVLLFTTYINLLEHKVDSAGVGAAWSGLYLLLASRRKPPGGFRNKWTVRGVVRGSTMGLCLANLVSEGLYYGLKKREKEGDEGDSV